MRLILAILCASLLAGAARAQTVGNPPPPAMPPYVMNPNNATAAEKTTFGSRVGVGLPVPFFTAPANSVIALDIAPGPGATDQGVTTGVAWSDWCNANASSGWCTDTGSVNYNSTRVGIFENGNSYISSTAGGVNTSGFLGLNINSSTKGVGIGKMGSTEADLALGLTGTPANPTKLSYDYNGTEEFALGRVTSIGGFFSNSAVGDIAIRGIGTQNIDIGTSSSTGNYGMRIATGATPQITMAGAAAVAGAITAPGLAASSGATTGTLCWTTSTGNFTVDTTTTCLASDIRTKTKVGRLGPMLAEIMAMKPIHYENKPGMGLAALGEEVGLSAQDMLKVDPRLVALYAAGPDKGTPQGVRYQQLTAVLVKGEQELLARIVALESQNVKLQAQLRRTPRHR